MQIRLTKLKKGEKAIVAALPDDTEKIRKLLIFGVLPGTEIILLQLTPSFVLRVGNTMLALDREIAETIIVNKLVK